MLDKLTKLTKENQMVDVTQIHEKMNILTNYVIVITLKFAKM